MTTMMIEYRFSIVKRDVGPCGDDFRGYTPNDGKNEIT